MLLRAVFRPAALAVALTLASLPALADFVVGRPPAVLSPDFRDPALRQVRPGETAAYATGVKAGAARKPRGLDPAFLPQVVAYRGKEAAGTIVIDTNRRFLFLVLGDGKARRYGVGVGRPGFEWAGAHPVTMKAEWPAWTPPPEMRQRQPNLPVSMKGGPGNPLGARALYLGDTLYRIHGTAEPWTIGQAVSSGCIRMRNEDVIDLYGRVPVGTRVVVI